MKKILIVNKGGFIGSGVHESLSAEYVVGGVSESGSGQNTRQLDTNDKYAVGNFFKGQSFDVIIYCPQETRRVPEHEGSKHAYDLKIEETRNIVDVAKHKDSKFIYISSKNVYGGDDPPYRTGSERAPVNEYGKACLESEYIVQKELDNYCIIRPGKVYGFTEQHGYDEFTQRVLDLDSSGPAKFDDEIVEYPTLVDDLVDLVRKIIDHDLTSNYNISSSRDVTNYEWAKLICEVHGIGSDRIIPDESFQRRNRPYDVEFDLDSITDLGLSVKSVKRGLKIARMQNLCTFRPIYIQELNENFGEISSSSIRHRLGAALAKRDTVDVDAVVPIPKSGIYPASGYANSSQAPLKFALAKQELRHRTLYDTSIDRGEVMDDAMKAIPEMVADKSIVVVDEALLSGTTIKSVVPKLASAREIHVRISSPPVVRSCPAGVYPDGTELLTKTVGGLEDTSLSTVESRLTDVLGVSSINFVPTDTYSRIVEKPEGNCTHCFLQGDE